MNVRFLALALTSSVTFLGPGLGAQDSLPGRLYLDDRPDQDSLPGRLYLDDRPDPAWISLQEARATGPVSAWSAFGEFAPRSLIAMIDSRRRWAQNPELLNDLPVEVMRRATRTRDEQGKCNRTISVGGSGPRFGSAEEFVQNHDRVVVGTIESQTLGFFYGRQVTVYGLRVDTVISGSGRPSIRTGGMVFIPHGDFDASIEGFDVCHWALSRPATPEIGHRAAIGMRKRQLLLWAGQAKKGARYTFAGAWVTARFWFETEHGMAWTSVPDESRRWNRVERELAKAAQREPAAEALSR